MAHVCDNGAFHCGVWEWRVRAGAAPDVERVRMPAPCRLERPTNEIPVMGDGNPALRLPEKQRTEWMARVGHRGVLCWLSSGDCCFVSASNWRSPAIKPAPPRQSVFLDTGDHRHFVGLSVIDEKEGTVLVGPSFFVLPQAPPPTTDYTADTDAANETLWRLQPGASVVWRFRSETQRQRVWEELLRAPTTLPVEKVESSLNLRFGEPAAPTREAGTQGRPLWAAGAYATLPRDAAVADPQNHGARYAYTGTPWTGMQLEWVAGNYNQKLCADYVKQALVRRRSVEIDDTQNADLSRDALAHAFVLVARGWAGRRCSVSLAVSALLRTACFLLGEAVSALHSMDGVVELSFLLLQEHRPRKIQQHLEEAHTCVSVAFRRALWQYAQEVHAAWPVRDVQYVPRLVSRAVPPRVRECFQLSRATCLERRVVVWTLAMLHASSVKDSPEAVYWPRAHGRINALGTLSGPRRSPQRCYWDAWLRWPVMRDVLRWTACVAATHLYRYPPWMRMGECELFTPDLPSVEALNATRYYIGQLKLGSVYDDAYNKAVTQMLLSFYWLARTKLRRPLPGELPLLTSSPYRQASGLEIALALFHALPDELSDETLSQTSIVAPADESEVPWWQRVQARVWAGPAERLEVALRSRDRALRTKEQRDNLVASFNQGEHLQYVWLYLGLALGGAPSPLLDARLLPLQRPRRELVQLMDVTPTLSFLLPETGKNAPGLPLHYAHDWPPL